MHFLGPERAFPVCCAQAVQDEWRTCHAVSRHATEVRARKQTDNSEKNILHSFPEAQKKGTERYNITEVAQEK